MRFLMLVSFDCEVRCVCVIKCVVEDREFVGKF